MNEEAVPLIHRILIPFVTLKGSSRSIALGTSIGVFVAFSPTIGLQMIFGAFLATLLGASRPAAMVPAWITNPVTITPIFGFTYWLGSFIWPGPSVADVRIQLARVAANEAGIPWYALHRYFLEFLKVGLDVFVAMTIGGIIVGGVCAALTYPLMVGVVHGYRLARRKRRQVTRIYERDPDGEEEADGA
ncbi:MAG: DUF2062 domain-containing protein [Planctomycetota bacterium]|jgi:uncharacterized protein (DUF2062 family)